MSDLHKSTMDRLLAASPPVETQENYLFSESKEKKSKEKKSEGIPIDDIRSMLSDLIEQERLSTIEEKNVIEVMEDKIVGNIVNQEMVANAPSPDVPAVIPVVILTEGPKSDSFELNGIEAFLDWLGQNKKNFTGDQLTAFSALESARAVIYAGCSCQQGRRANRANDYFKFFFESNRETDIILSIKKAANTNLLILKNYLGEFVRL